MIAPNSKVEVKTTVRAPAVGIVDRRFGSRKRAGCARDKFSTCSRAPGNGFHCRVMSPLETGFKLKCAVKGFKIVDTSCRLYSCNSVGCGPASSRCSRSCFSKAGRRVSRSFEVRRVFELKTRVGPIAKLSVETNCNLVASTRIEASALEDRGMSLKLNCDAGGSFFVSLTTGESFPTVRCCVPCDSCVFGNSGVTRGKFTPRVKVEGDL